MDITIVTKIDEEEIKDLLITAIEGGAN